jgi:hypothetical protein
MARGAGEPATPAVWSSELASTATGRLRFADLDGDARADVCLWSGRGVSCARSRGDGFDRARVWLAGGDAAWGATFQLGDVDGDGRADACGRTKDGLSCAPSTGTAFGRLRPWSLGADFADGGTLRLGDVNGDGRADACARGPHGVSCALSTGRAFTSATMWMAEGMKDEDGWRAREDTLVLADVNGDGRADIITGRGPGGPPQVIVFDGVTGKQLVNFNAYNPFFQGGVRVGGIEDINGDGKDDIITGAGPSGGPQIEVFDGQTRAALDSFFEFDPRFLGGVFVGGH